MSRVDELIEALMEEYFDEENTCERYKIFEKVEKAMKEARAVTCEQIENLEEFRSQFTVAVEDAKVLSQMSDVIRTAGMLDQVFLTRETTFQEISEMGCIDSLDMVEITMTFEEILNVEIGGEPPEPETTIGDILDLRK